MQASPGRMSLPSPPVQYWPLVHVGAAAKTGSTLTVPASTTVEQLPAGMPEFTQPAKAVCCAVGTPGLGLGGMGAAVLAMRTTARAPLVTPG